MNITRLFAVVVLLCCYSCSSTSDSEYKKPERLSVLIADSHVFDGMVSVMSGSHLITLKAMSMVYVTDDSLGINNAKYVRVLWGDSTGYVPADWLLLYGRVGVLTTPEGANVEVYSDKELKNNSGNILGDWTLAAVRQVDNNSAEVRYMNGQTPAIGYISPQSISLDTLDVAFFRAYAVAKEKDNAGDPSAMKALMDNMEFASLITYQRVFPHMDEPSSDDEGSEAIFGATYNDDLPTGWFDEAKNEISKEEWPAVIKAMAIFDDGSEQEILLPGGLWSRRIGQDESGPAVEKFRLLLSPAVMDNFTFEVISSNNWGEPDTHITHIFESAEPGKKYEFVIGNEELHTHLPCSHITIKVSMGNKVFTTRIICDCPGA